ASRGGISPVPSRARGRTSVALVAGPLAVTTLVLAGSVAWADPGAVDRQRTVVRALEAELVGLDARAGAAVSAEHAAAARLAAVRAEVRENGAELRTARADLRRSRALLAKRLVAIYRDGTPTLADILLDSGGITATATRFSTLERIGHQDSMLVTNVRWARDRRQPARPRLVPLRAESAQRLAAATSERRTAVALLDDRRAVLVRSRATLDVLIAQEAAREAAAARQAAAQAQAARLAALRAARSGVNAAVAHPTVLPPAPPPPAPTPPAPPPVRGRAQSGRGGAPGGGPGGGPWGGKFQVRPAAGGPGGRRGPPRRGARGGAGRGRRTPLLAARSGPLAHLRTKRALTRD